MDKRTREGSASDVVNALRRAAHIAGGLPPEPFLGVWSLAPVNEALKFRSGGREYVAIHPHSYLKLRELTRKPDPVGIRTASMLPFSGITIRNMDGDRDARIEFGEALLALMTESEG